jgi:hypothetical protein
VEGLTVNTSPSLRALLTGIVDYAGLFPPAQLSLDESIRNYARYRTEPEGWMLGQFICPAARLTELSPYVVELFHDGPPLAISALGRGGKDVAAFRDGQREDVNDITEFRRRHGERVTVGVYETRLPSAVAADDLTELFVSAARLSDPDRLMPFYEVKGGDEWTTAMPTFVGAIGAARKALKRSNPIAGFKVRCGGLEPAAFPSPAQVALAITIARSIEVPLKLTAGLHHPIRHQDGSVGVTAHGFLNVFGAGVLAASRGLDGATVREIIEDEDAGDFIFTDDGLRWHNHVASVTEIELARRTAATSFGSCSFDEPRDDLRALGLLGGP